MKKTIIVIFILFCISSCNQRAHEYVKFPKGLITTHGQNVDSLIQNSTYTALVFYCDNCGKGVSDLYCWDNIVKKNGAISPLIIIKSKNPKLVETYLDIYKVNYPRVIYDFDTIRKDNSNILTGDVTLIDNKYMIINNQSPLNNRFVTWKYINISKQ